jgi:hypothetical protein
MTEAEWQAQLAAAKDVLPTLNARQAEMVMFRLTALIDGHSGIVPAQIGYHLYALRLYHFTDGYFVLDGPDRTAIGGQLVAINGMPVEDAVRLVTRLAAHDNDKSIEVVVPMFLMTLEMLDGLGIVDDIAKPHFDVRRADGSEVVLDPEMLDWDPYIARFGGVPVGLPKAPAPLSQSRRDEAFWWTIVGDALYFQYNEVRVSSSGDSLSKVVGEMRPRLAGGGVTRVIVDVRHNPGGDNPTYPPLLNLLLDPLVNRPAYLYVIIGRQTFSAATNFCHRARRAVVGCVCGRTDRWTPEPLRRHSCRHPAELTYQGQRVFALLGEEHSRRRSTVDTSRHSRGVVEQHLLHRRRPCVGCRAECVNPSTRARLRRVRRGAGRSRLRLGRVSRTDIPARGGTP